MIAYGLIKIKKLYLTRVRVYANTRTVAQEQTKTPATPWVSEPGRFARCEAERTGEGLRQPAAKKRAGKNKRQMAMQTTEPLTEAQLESINGSLASIDSQLAFLVGLTALERQRLAKMGQKTSAFVEDAILAGIRNPACSPGRWSRKRCRARWRLRTSSGSFMPRCFSLANGWRHPHSRRQRAL